MMLRKFVLPLAAVVTLLGAPAFAATDAAPAPAKTMRAPVAKSASAPAAAMHARHARKRHVLRRVRHHRHVAVMKARPAKRT